MDNPLLVRVLHGVADGSEESSRSFRRSLASSQYRVMGLPLTSSITK